MRIHPCDPVFRHRLSPTVHAFHFHAGDWLPGESVLQLKAYLHGILHRVGCHLRQRIPGLQAHRKLYAKQAVSRPVMQPVAGHKAVTLMGIPLRKLRYLHAVEMPLRILIDIHCRRIDLRGIPFRKHTDDLCIRIL